jgi:hypothetical protein
MNKPYSYENDLFESNARELCKHGLFETRRHAAEGLVPWPQLLLGTG